ncbi:MAG: trypsin-like peptidase domain-containing protein [Acidobacteria bacterium]|nr:trypsin-like peptidase domain-containing protein [Acidobacteriota bacterium]MCA1619777.1 trypsin-like peptidase domain-containing protein [Acidobacteriota bacterium]
MLQIPKGQTTESERAILRHLRVWIAALAVGCLVVGVGVGAMLSRTSVLAGEEQPAGSAAAIARAPEALSASFAEIARRVEPAVVNIDTVSAAPAVADKDGDDDEEGEGGDNPLLDMLRRHARRPSRGVGSGFVVDPKGIILTNFHVVENMTGIMVKLQTGEQLRGTVIGRDEETDIAVIKVNAGRDLPAVNFGNSDEMQVGDWVLAIGSPFGLEQTVTAGIISTKERQTDPGASFRRFIQTDAAINRGNSGGPLVNMRGEVIGINSQIATSTGDYNGIGFALPTNIASSVYKQLMTTGKVRRGYLGVFLDSVKPEFARVYNLPKAAGAIIRDVADAKGPAATAGIQTNDVVVEFNGQSVESAQDLINKVASTPVGTSVPVIYLREMADKLERRSTNVTVGERPPPRGGVGAGPESERDAGGAKLIKPKAEEEAPKSDRPTLGLKLSELTPQIANERNLKGVRGLFVQDVDQAGIAFDAGVQKFMVIQRVNRQGVSTIEDFERVINALKAGDPIVLHVSAFNGERVTQSIVQFTYQ